MSRLKQGKRPVQLAGRGKQGRGEAAKRKLRRKAWLRKLEAKRNKESTDTPPRRFRPRTRAEMDRHQASKARIASRRLRQGEYDPALLSVIARMRTREEASGRQELSPESV